MLPKVSTRGSRLRVIITLAAAGGLIGGAVAIAPALSASGVPILVHQVDATSSAAATASGNAAVSASQPVSSGTGTSAPAPTPSDTATTASSGTGGTSAAGAGGDPFVALGDTYSSGMGTYAYRSGDRNPDCARSDQTYSVVYAKNYQQPPWLGLGQVQPVLLACAGATTAALTSDFTTSSGTTEPAQLSTGALGVNTKLVTITIGGNDVGFEPTLRKMPEPGEWR